MSELWLLIGYMIFAWGSMYLITGPPLEQWLRKRQPNLDAVALQKWRDRFMLVWAIINLLLIIFWLVNLYPWADFSGV